MSTNLTRCGRCNGPLSAQDAITGSAVTCPSCRETTWLSCFPALLQPLPEGAAPSPVLEGDEATCYHHSQYRAERACDQCGRYICTLCDVVMDGEHVCPQCLEAAAQPGSDSPGTERFQRTYRRHDHIVAATALLPLFFMIALPVTAPLALVLGVRALRQPPLPYGGGRVRIVLSMGIALLQLVLMLVLAGSMLMWFFT